MLQQTFSSFGKMLKLIIALAIIITVLPTAVKAQDRTITGTILSDEDKEPLAGVTIRLKGSKKTVLTNTQGRFTVQAKAGDELQITSVGYQPVDIKVGGTDNINISLKVIDKSLTEVVVTAMDIKRNPKELPYATQKVDAEDVKETQRENFLNGLQGRVAGLTLDQTSGVAGASSSVVLRGFNSLSLSNSPLYVVDGVILDNQSVNETSSGGQGIGLASDRPNRSSDYQNRIADINPNDIAQITVLKGPEATALYGSQASSGAIIITTKKPKNGKLAVQYDNSFRMQKVTRFTDVYDFYKNGANSSPGSIFSYFGPSYATGDQIYNNKNKFFRTGFAQTHNLGVDFGIKKALFRFSGSFFDQKGVVPNNDFRRYNLRLSNTTKFFGGKLEFTPSIAYIKSENKKVLRSAGGYYLSLLAWPSTNDITDYEDFSTGDKLDLFSGTTANGEVDNPFFNVNKNRAYDETDRKTASLGININPLKWLSITGRFGYDTYDVFGYQFFHPQSFYVGAASGGTLDNYWRKYNGYNHTITATAKKQLGKNFNARLMVGNMWQDYETQMFSVYGTNIVDYVNAPGTTDGRMYRVPRDANGAPIAGAAPVLVTDRDLTATLGNYMDSSITRPGSRLRLLRNGRGEYNQNILRQGAYFGEVGFSYKNLAFLSYSHRFEEASTLPEQNRKYNYPGGGVSLIMSDIIPQIKKGGIVNYWKLRSSLAATARLNSPYSTQSVFVNNFASGGGFSYGFFNNSPDLAPERQSTYEIGTELKLFKSRLGLDITYYNTLNKGQIVQAFRLSYGTGFVLNTQNAASTRNKGLEIAADYAVLKNTKLKWNTKLNNKMYNEVIGLPANIAEYYISDTWLYSNARGGLVKGGSTTSITATTYLRNKDGKIIVSPTSGIPLTSGGVFNVVGDRNPDFTIGWSNTLSYKGFRLTFLWDLKYGGDIFNGNDRYLTNIGRSRRTADRYTPRVVEGVLADGLENSANPTKNTIVVTPAYNNTFYTSMPDEEFVEKKVNWFRLRDITLNYTFNKKLIRQMKSLSLFVTANDLVLFTNYTGADPAVNGNTAATPGVGAFGFDYGTLPAAVQLNFGLRANF
jgi:TonB-linked SusC/RagA family outer membrane protein